MDNQDKRNKYGYLVDNNGNLSFRKLLPHEIKVRVQSVNENGAILLLYKDARVDQAILDETVGPMNWQRKHSRDNKNCTVEIWDFDKDMWVGKEDVGSESNTEKEKGLASDSFKRACYNWGVGRELYEAPFIWIPANKFKILTRKNGGAKYTNDKFRVASVTFGHKSGLIDGLAIKNQKNQVVWMQHPKDVEKQREPEPIPDKSTVVNQSLNVESEPSQSDF